MTTTATERKTGIPTIEEIESQCSLNGKKLLESADSFAQFSKHDLGVQDIAIALFSNDAILTLLEEYLHINPGQTMESFIGIINSGRKKHKPAGSIQDIFNVAREESIKAGASRIRAGDWLMAIYHSPTEAGETFKEALLSVANNEKGVGLPFALRSAIKQVEKPWAA